MAQEIDESVSVDLASWIVYWRGRQYRINKIGFHHTTREGRVLFHVFSVTDGTTFFKLRFDTETLGWRLLEIDS